jgi:hypothetical protein
MKSKDSLVFLLLIAILVVSLSTTVGQGICDNSNYAKGDFSLSHQAICGLTQLEVTNKSAATNVQYYFSYKGEDLLEAMDSSKALSRHTYPILYQPRTYTIIQIGKLAGKTSVACKNVVVRSNNVPLHSYSICGRDLEIAIPLDSLNNFDYYRLVISGISSTETFTAAQVPKRILKTIALPSTYSLTGFYNNPSKNCTNNTVQQTIPRETVVTNHQHTPNINKLELLDLKNVRLDYTGPFKVDNNSTHKLMMYERGQYNAAKEVIKDIVPGSYKISVPDSAKSFCFIVRKDQACNGIQEESAEICTIPIFSSQYDPLKNEHTIQWVPYTQTHKGLLIPIFGALATSTISFSQILELQSSTLPSTMGVSISPSQTKYSQSNINCTTKTYLRIKERIIGTFRFKKFEGVSLSNKVNFDAQKLIPPRIENLWTSTNTQNNNELIFQDNTQTWPFKKEQWYLHKAIDGQFKIIDSSTVNNILTDKSVASKTEFYKLSYKDECRRRSEISESVNTIFIAKNNTESLVWNKATPFLYDNIESSRLVSLDNDLKTEIQNQNLTLNTFITQFKNFFSEDDLRLQIQSKSRDKFSNSNILIIPRPLDIYIPNIYSPNGDGINDHITIKGNLKNLISMDFQLFNRDGNQIFKANSIETLEEWSKNLTKEPVQTIYPYKLKLIYNTNEVRVISGTIIASTN